MTRNLTTAMTMTAALATAMIAGACTGAVPTAPSAPAATQLAGRVAVGGNEARDFTSPRDGTLSATLNWTYSNDLDLVVTDDSCAALDFSRCTTLALGATRTPRGESRLERVTRTVRRGETLRFWIENLDDAAPAPYSLDITIQ